jgi:gas vesicle protein
MMENQDKSPDVVTKRDSGMSIGYFFLGALVGAGLALLLAPQSGEETQEEIRGKAKKIRTATEKRMRHTQGTLESQLGTVREDVRTRISIVRDAVESGRKAAEEARRELEVQFQNKTAGVNGGDSS